MKLELNNEELNDLWSALTVWRDKLKSEKRPEMLAPITLKAVEKLIVKIRKALA